MSSTPRRTSSKGRLKLGLGAAVMALGAIGLAGGTFISATPAYAVDLGVEGEIFEPIEEDFRLALLRLMALQDWSEQTDALKDSAKNYTKNLPQYSLPRAQKLQTQWKDVGIVTTEDIYFPSIDWETGSVFEPEKKLAVKAGTYLNPIAQLPAAGIDRLFLFDATDPEQLAMAKDLMGRNVPLLNFMVVSGDLGPLSEEMAQPIFHLSSDMIDKFNIRAVPSLVGFGRGPHQGHMAITEFPMPMNPEQVKAAWYGLPYPGYDPENIKEFAVSVEEAQETRKALELAAEEFRNKQRTAQNAGPAGQR